MNNHFRQISKIRKDKEQTVPNRHYWIRKFLAKFNSPIGQLLAVLGLASIIGGFMFWFVFLGVIKLPVGFFATRTPTVSAPVLTHTPEAIVTSTTTDDPTSQPTMRPTTQPIAGFSAPTNIQWTNMDSDKTLLNQSDLKPTGCIISGLRDMKMYPDFSVKDQVTFWSNHCYAAIQATPGSMKVYYYFGTKGTDPKKWFGANGWSFTIKLVKPWTIGIVGPEKANVDSVGDRAFVGYGQYLRWSNSFLYFQSMNHSK